MVSAVALRLPKGCSKETRKGTRVSVEETFLLDPDVIDRNIQACTVRRSVYFKSIWQVTQNRRIHVRSEVTTTLTLTIQNIWVIALSVTVRTA